MIFHKVFHYLIRFLCKSCTYRQSKICSFNWFSHSFCGSDLIPKDVKKQNLLWIFKLVCPFYTKIFGFDVNCSRNFPGWCRVIFSRIVTFTGRSTFLHNLSVMIRKCSPLVLMIVYTARTINCEECILIDIIFYLEISEHSSVCGWRASLWIKSLSCNIFRDSARILQGDASYCQIFAQYFARYCKINFFLLSGHLILQN